MRIAAGVSAGSLVQSGSFVNDGRQHIGRTVAAERPLPREHLVEDAAKRPEVRASVHGFAPRLLGTHVRRRPEDDAGLGRMRAQRRRAASRPPPRCSRTSRPLASPKSSTFTVPSSRTLMFAGFRSRWMIPCSCAASRASAICEAIASASLMGIAPLRDPIGERRALDQLHHQGVYAVGVFEPVDLRDVRMIERREHLRFSPEAGEAIGIVGDGGQQDLDRDLAIRASCRGLW